MRNFMTLIIFMPLIIGSLGTHAQEPALADLAKMVLPAVVHIQADENVGAGFFIYPDGHFVTNAHVVGNRKTMTVGILQDNDKTVNYEASVVRVNKAKDIALGKVNLRNLPVLRIADGDVLQVGENVVAFGSPSGLNHSLVQGVVSGQNRNINGVSMLQLNIFLNPGVSGGPVVNRMGEVVGIATATIPGEGTGFAISTSELLQMLCEWDIGFSQSSSLSMASTEVAKAEDTKPSVQWYALPLVIAVLFFFLVIVCAGILWVILRRKRRLHNAKYDDIDVELIETDNTSNFADQDIDITLNNEGG